MMSQEDEVKPEMAEQVQNESELATSWQYTDEFLLAGWRSVYPLISELFSDLENCPRLYRLVAKKHPQILQSLLDRWQQLGRPRVEWPELSQDQSSPTPLATSLSGAVEDRRPSNPSQ